MFKNRTEAGLLLAEKLKHYKNRDGVILAVPRGGVVIGKVIAEYLELPLEIVLSKKIGHPLQPEFAVGAVSLESIALDPAIKVPKEYIEQETRRIRELLRERYRLYGAGRKQVNLEDKIVIIVDDGIATGHTILSTAQLVRHHRPRRVVVAVPVASPQTIAKMKKTDTIDEVICLESPREFFAVGQFYEAFPQVTDNEVIALLSEFQGTQKKQN